MSDRRVAPNRQLAGRPQQPHMKYFTIPRSRCFFLLALLACGPVQGAPGKSTAKSTNAEPEVKTMPRFDNWPVPPRRTNVAPAVATPPAKPPVADAQKKLYSFRAENLEIKPALAIFARLAARV